MLLLSLWPKDKRNALHYVGKRWVGFCMVITEECTITLFSITVGELGFKVFGFSDLLSANLNKELSFQVRVSNNGYHPFDCFPINNK